jgi:hypothetical protein
MVTMLLAFLGLTVVVQAQLLVSKEYGKTQLVMGEPRTIVYNFYNMGKR